MRHLSLLKVARAVPDPDNDPSVCIVYRIFGCTQSKDVNLKDLPYPVMQRFAVINPQRLDDEVFELLEAARDVGALAPVKLMDVREDSLYLLLDTKVDSTIFTTIESLWMGVMGANSHRHFTVHSACESEVFSGRSDYHYWWGAKEILETEKLGLTRDVLTAIATPITENERPEELCLRTGHDAYLVYSTMRMSDIQSRPGCRDKNKKKPGPISPTRKELERYWALINERMLSESPRSRKKEYCVKRWLSGNSTWDMLEPIKRGARKNRPP